MVPKDDPRTPSQKQEENNEEYAHGYDRGRGGDFERDAIHETFSDPDSQESKGYTAGQNDREEHGWRESEKCYLTTACTLSMGLPDNCLELNVLRGFRDKFLLRSGATRTAVKEYYKIAPQIVAAVNSRGSEEANRVWRGVYSQISHAVGLIQSGRFNEAFEHYKDMTLSLQKKYL